MKKIIGLLLLGWVLITTVSAQVNIPAGSTLAAHCEYGSKGTKLSVFVFTDKNFRKFKILESTELNITLAKGLNASGILPTKEINNGIQTTSDAFNQLVAKYKPLGLKDINAVYYASSGLAMINNIKEFADSVKAKTGKGLYIVNVNEEAKYTIAGTIPFDKIANALVIDQGSGNTKGGYVIVDGKSLTGITLSFDLGSISVYNLIVNKFMPERPDDKDLERQLFITAMNKAFDDTLKAEIRNTLETIEGASTRNELYLSGGAAYVITTLLYPEADQTQQLTEISYDKIKAFLTDIQDKEYYKKLKERTFTSEGVQKNHTKALGIYTHLQLISATKLLLTYVNALSADDKKIFFNNYGLHAMPSMLLGRVLRGDIPRW